MPRDLRHLMPLTATVLRLTRVPSGWGEWEEAFAPVGQLKCRVTEPQLVQRTDQQGRLGADLVRTLYTLSGENIQTGDRVQLPQLGVTCNVEGAVEQADGAYRKALLVQE